MNMRMVRKEWCRRSVTSSLAVAAITLAGATQLGAQERDPNDPRIGLRAGWTDAATAI